MTTTIDNAQKRYEQISAMSPEELAAKGIKAKPNGSYSWENGLGINVSIFANGDTIKTGTVTEPIAEAVNRNFEGGEKFAGQYGDKFKSTRNAETRTGNISWSNPKNIYKVEVGGRNYYDSHDYHKHSINADGSLGKLRRVC